MLSALWGIEKRASLDSTHATAEYPQPWPAAFLMADAQPFNIELASLLLHGCVMYGILRPTWWTLKHFWNDWKGQLWSYVIPGKRIGFGWSCATLCFYSVGSLCWWWRWPIFDTPNCTVSCLLEWGKKTLTRSQWHLELPVIPVVARHQDSPWGIFSADVRLLADPYDPWHLPLSQRHDPLAVSNLHTHSRLTPGMPRLVECQLKISSSRGRVVTQWSARYAWLTTQRNLSRKLWLATTGHAASACGSTWR